MGWSEEAGGIKGVRVGGREAEDREGGGAVDDVNHLNRKTWHSGMAPICLL